MQKMFKRYFTKIRNFGLGVGGWGGFEGKEVLEREREQNLTDRKTLIRVLGQMAGNRIRESCSF